MRGKGINYDTGQRALETAQRYSAGRAAAGERRDRRPA
jgi:hypothetical protein